MLESRIRRIALISRILVTLTAISNHIRYIIAPHRLRGWGSCSRFDDNLLYHSKQPNPRHLLIRIIRDSDF